MTRFARLPLLLLALIAMLAPPPAAADGFDPGSLLCRPGGGPLPAEAVADLRYLAELAGEPANEAPGHTFCDFACAAAQSTAAPTAPAEPLRRVAILPAPRPQSAPAPAGRPETALRGPRAPPVLV
ncbi:hypothetical protein ACWCOP_14390 [Maricaulaceae bacterium MS644]